MTTRRTRSPAPADLDLSPEVAYYLESRGIPAPTCPPRWKTPEPRTVRGARFDPSRVDRVLEALSRLVHTQGVWAGHPLKPDPWQVAYILAPVYGWVRKNAEGRYVRIIRTEYLELPRKNGKTTLTGGQAMYMTAADGEAGAQVLAAATGRDQAGYTFDPVREIARRSPHLTDFVRVVNNRILHQRSGSYFAVVSSVADLLHGANVHLACIDELHLHKKRDLVDALETGTGAREQPLIIITTTADDGSPGSIYAEKRDYLEKLARGVIKDPSFYGVVWAADPEDDPFAEDTWRKANPGYGVSPTRSFLESEAAKAQQSPANRARFLRLFLGIRTKQTTKYFELHTWDRNSSIVDEQELRGREAYGGLDLANVSDLCALAWDFPNDDGSHEVLWRFWLPERGFDRLVERTAGQARVWRDRGLLTVTPGEVTDYDYIRAAINADRERFNVREIAFDPWNATQLVNDLLGDDAPMMKMQQGFRSLSGPTKQLQHLLLEGTPDSPRYRHGGNPVMRWMVDNVAIAMDPNGNVKPDRSRAVDKIDGVVAAVMALDRAINRPEKRVSAYEETGLEVI